MTATESKVSTWNIDPVHSSVEFSVRHMMIAKVRGRFCDFSGTIQFNPENLAVSTVEISIDVASINTDNEQRDGHLKSADFFDAENYPAITFVCTSVKPKDDRHFTIVGDLTIKDVTREVELDTTYHGQIVDAYGNDRIAFEAATEIKRSNFAINWNAPLEAGGVVVSDAVRISLDIAAVRASDEG